MIVFKKMFFILCLFVSHLFFIQNVFAHSEYFPTGIIGEDKRIRFSSNEYPWTTFGTVVSPNTSICTGTLVGPRLVLTNAHCINFSNPIYFYPSYNNGDYLNRKAQEILAVKVYANNLVSNLPSPGKYINYTMETDWAILVLDEAVGEDFKWLEVLPFADKFLNTNNIFNFSYGDAGTRNDYGEYPLLNEKCSIHANLYDYLWHDCSTGYGSSGSSLVTTIGDKTYIVGLHNGSVGTDYCSPFTVFQCGNTAVKTNQFIDVLKKALLENG